MLDELLKRVPKPLHPRYQEIVALTDAYCAAHLTDEFRDLCRKLAAHACGAGVPVGGGKPAGWAAGVVAAVGYVNFFGDPSQPFHTAPAEMARRLGVSPATMQSKSKAIRDALDVSRTDHRFSSAKMAEGNPLIWILNVNGVAMDIRHAPRGAQEEAYRNGLIPYIPADRGRPRPSPPPAAPPAGPARVYTLDVMLLSGPITAAFAKKHRKGVSRTIAVRGDQTLEALHDALFAAFDRDDPHMYEFQFGRKPMDPDGPRYVLPMAADDDFGPPIAGLVTETTIDQLKLTPGRRFGYWFDFGDDWHHQITVAGIADGPGDGDYPRVTNRVGDSPPQYPDWDAEGE